MTNWICGYCGVIYPSSSYHQCSTASDFDNRLEKAIQRSNSQLSKVAETLGDLGEAFASTTEVVTEWSIKLSPPLSESDFATEPEEQKDSDLMKYRKRLITLE